MIFFCNFCPTTKRHFFYETWKEEHQEKEYQEKLKTSKRWNRQGINTTQWGKTWDKTQKKRGFKNQRPTRKFWICSGKKNRFGDEEKKKVKKKEEKKNEIKNKREREEKWVKTKRGYAKTAMEKKTDKETWDTEKRERETLSEIQKKKEWRKEMNKMMKGESEQRQEWWKKKKKNVGRKKWIKKALNKKWSFLSDFCGFKTKREETENRIFERFSKKTTFLILDTKQWSKEETQS